MPKRKRTEADDAAAQTEHTESDAGSIDTGRLASKLHHHLRVLRTAAKRARTFDTQRTVRRLKAAKSDNDRSALERDLAILKNLDTATIAAQALLAKCAKSRLLPKHGHKHDGDAFPLIAALRTEASIFDLWTASPEQRASSLGGAEEKVHARIASSKILAEEVGTVVAALQSVLKPGLAPASSGQDSGRGHQPTSQHDDDAHTKSIASKTRKATQASARRNDDAGNLSSRRDGADDTGTEASIDRRISTTRDMPTVDTDDQQSDQRRSDDNHTADDDEVDSDDDEHNLPALSSGFVTHGLSFRDRGSDSEYSGGSDDNGDIDEHAEDTAAVGADGKKTKAGKDAKRKNRMGQRARQALWEKKYGRNARHIAILQREPRSKRPIDPSRSQRGGPRGRESASHAPQYAQSPGGPAVKRDQGWASVRGQALAPQPKSNTGLRPSRYPGPASARTGLDTHARSPARSAPHQAPSSVPTSRPPTAAAPHPSWVAKQKQKEQLSQAFSLKPVGKKVVFD